MEPTLDGGGESIKVGSTGTISTLMSKELDPVSVSKSKTSSSRKVKNHTRNRTHQIPMLAADDNTSTDATPVRRPKPVRRGLVEIVDIKCANPIKDHLKKLNFSKLSESIV